MIFDLETTTKKIEKLHSKTLKNIDWLEKDLQELLFGNIEKIIEENDLFIIMQSREWQEEPDLMAIDNKGDLFIFELKAWESEDKNLLQVLRYGQIFGQNSYDELNSLYRKHFPENDTLIDSINEKFELQLKENDINNKQHFVIITNGLDYKTREAILYWRSQGLDTRSWIYRIYEVESKILFEINTFEINENPYSDVEAGYYILNTNKNNSVDDHNDMLQNKKAAAYFDPWKRKIEKLKNGNVVFLYESSIGIVAYGYCSGKINKANYQGDEQYYNEEYFTKLNRFVKLENPITARKIKEITGVNYRFLSTIFSIDEDSAKTILKYIENTIV